MSFPVSGKCCVCARVTSTRCSACGDAGIGIFFCSREHQKLVYFAHKKVCGERANPFLWPDLSEEEAEEAGETLDDNPDHSGLRFLSLRQEVGLRYPHLAGHGLPSLIRSLTSPSPAKNLSPALQQHLLLLVYNSQSRQHMKATLLSGDIYSFQSRSTPIHFAASAMSQFLNELGRPFPHDKSWYTELHHRVLIKSTLCFLNGARQGGTDRSELYVKTKMLLYGFFDEVEQTDPGVGRSFRASQDKTHWVK
ncbi:hypothetical protein JCM6882_000854 [Rhodosporidiobolus microsporus]